MGSSALVGQGKDVGNGGGVGGAGGCCDMSMKCWCRWRCEKDYYRALSWLNNGVVFLLGCLAVFGSIGMVYVWLVFTPASGRGGGVGGCEEDSEGSWSIGVFYGDSPFSLRPIEDVNVWRDQTSAWPVANPVVTCASVSDAGFPSNFVADPFLYLQGRELKLIDTPFLTNTFLQESCRVIRPQVAWIRACAGFLLETLDGGVQELKNWLLMSQEDESVNAGTGLILIPGLFQEDAIYLFYETKNSVTLQGDIGVAKSIDNGATWEQLGIALDEDSHLSYPYVFNYNGQIYMMPEGSGKGQLRVYRALDFPLQWKLEKIVMRKPLVDAFVINFQGIFWLFGSDHSGFGARKNGQLEIWYSDSPFGPWKPHKKNPVYNTGKSSGARNGGRPFVHNGVLYRVGQDCGETYGRRVRVFKVEVLTKDEFKEVEVSLRINEPKKGRNAWNGARHHHLDVQQLSSGEWIAVMDGDRVPSGDSVHRFILGCASVAGVTIVAVVIGLLIGAVKCIVPINWASYGAGKRTGAFSAWERSNLMSSKVRRFCCRLNRFPPFIRSWVKENTCCGKFLLVLMFGFGVALMCMGVTYIYGGSGAEEPYRLDGQYSQFTLMTMTYDARLWNLRMYIKHYSRCSSVKEIVIVWNKGVPPKLSDFDSAVPIRIRVEPKNSLNNRFKMDAFIKTRAVLELDDDIMMTCDDIERGFKVWRKHPERIVGFYPRLIDGSPLKYRAEKFARSHNGYNMILTGAAFIDSHFAFRRYWGDEAKAGRDMVDHYFNCEDVLLNYLYANSSSSRTVEYVKPAWAIDTSKFSGAAISKDTKAHYRIRSRCLAKFSRMYGSLTGRKWLFNSRDDGWDL